MKTNCSSRVVSDLLIPTDFWYLRKVSTTLYRLSGKLYEEARSNLKV